MSIPRRGSRRIVVDEESYRWRLRRRPTLAQRQGNTPLLIAIAAEESEGPAMVVRLQARHPRNRVAFFSEAVTPAAVARYIREGLAAGWAPRQRGPLFTLEPASSDAPLPPRAFPKGLRPPNRAELEHLAHARPSEARDTLQLRDNPPERPRPGGGTYRPSGIEINGVELLELVRRAEQPHAEREAENRPDVLADQLAADYVGIPLRLLRGRGLLDQPITCTDEFSLAPDDPRLSKASLLYCGCRSKSGREFW